MVFLALKWHFWAQKGEMVKTGPKRAFGGQNGKKMGIFSLKMLKGADFRPLTGVHGGGGSATTNGGPPCDHPPPPGSSACPKRGGSATTKGGSTPYMCPPTVVIGLPQKGRICDHQRGGGPSITWQWYTPPTHTFSLYTPPCQCPAPPSALDLTSTPAPIWNHGAAGRSKNTKFATF